MARLPRLTFAGLPHHVIQRGHNGQAVFRGVEDYQFFLELLGQYAHGLDVAVHSYVLMPNHFHLLLTPPNGVALSHLLQGVGRRYVRHFNDAVGRTGTLWDGRYRCTVLQAERHLLSCMAYIDANPVRAGLVQDAADYPWSSYGHYTGRHACKTITPHAQFWGLGNTPFAREAAYAAQVQSGIGADQQRALTDATLKGWALGDAAFLAALQNATPRRLSKGQAGRPPREKSS